MGSRGDRGADRGRDMPRIPVVMARLDLDGIPDMDPPLGYRLRCFRSGDERARADVETAAGEFADRGRALERFASEFGPHLAEMSERCLFLETRRGEVIGTTTAWRNPSFAGGDWGRIHWVAVTPAHQGRGLGRLLVVQALRLLRGRHTRAYLTTQTTSWIAIHLYLSLGFVPALCSAAEEAGWALLRSLHPHPLLREPPYLSLH